MPSYAAAQEPSPAFRDTSYPLPRFVSLGSNEIYVRTGPGQKYPVQWVFKKKGIPVEIVLEYDNWRKIKDFDGDMGWVHKTLLSGRRAGFVIGESNVRLNRKPNESSDLLAYLEPKTLLSIAECDAQWCAVNASGYKGWVKQKDIWGVYEGEKFD